MKCTVLCFAFVCCVALVSALDCPPCDTTLCEPHGRCIAGMVKDYCNCCDVCAKIIGEECGGPGDIYGKCEHFSVCVKLPPTSEVKDFKEWFKNQKGICAPLE